MFLGRDCKPEALEGLKQWVVFPGVISATEMLSQPAKKLGWRGHSLERILQPHSCPPRLLGSSQASPPASLRLLQVKLLQAGSTVAVLQNSWCTKDQFFLVGASWGWRPRAAELWGQSLLAGATHAGLQEQQRCRHHFSTSFFHNIFPLMNMNAAPLQKCTALINEILIFLEHGTSLSLLHQQGAQTNMGSSSGPHTGLGRAFLGWFWGAEVALPVPPVPGWFQGGMAVSSACQEPSPENNLSPYCGVIAVARGGPEGSLQPPGHALAVAVSRREARGQCQPCQVAAALCWQHSLARAGRMLLECPAPVPALGARTAQELGCRGVAPRGQSLL